MKKLLFVALGLSMQIAFSANVPKPCSGEPGTRHPNGGGFVANGAHVDDTAFIGPSASICDHALILGNAMVFGHAQVFESGGVFGDTKVFDHAKVYGNAMILGYASVYENGRVCRGYTVIDVTTNQCTQSGSPLPSTHVSDGARDNSVPSYSLQTASNDEVGSKGISR